METGIAVVSSINAVTFFQPGASTDILEQLRVSVREEASRLDISTVAGRKAIASLSAKVAKTKTGLEAAGKELVADEKKRLKLIDDERGKIWDELEALQKEVRKPLTDWEESDKIRCVKLEADVMLMASYGSIPYGATTTDIEALLAKVNALPLTNMQEFTSRAELAESQTRKALTAALAEAKQRDADKAENERLKAEAVIREQNERDERIAKEAREKAQREAEEERKRIEEEKFQAEARAKQQEAARIEAEAKAERDAKSAAERQADLERLAEERRVAAESQSKKDAEEAAKRHAEAMEAARLKAKADADEAARQREEEHARHEEAIRIAAIKAKEERLAAIEAERERVVAEARKVAAELAAREKDKQHKASIHSAAMIALASIPGIDKEHAKAIVIAIAKGDIPNVRISY